MKVMSIVVCGHATEITSSGLLSAAIVLLSMHFVVFMCHGIKSGYIPEISFFSHMRTLLSTLWVLFLTLWLGTL
jgi:hypothetical protein